MKRFSFSHEDVSGETIRRLVADEASGAYVATINDPVVLT